MADLSAGPAPPILAVLAPVEAPAPVAEAPTPRPPAAPCGDAAGPVVEYPNPLTGRNTVNLSPHFVGRLGGAFSFMCTLTMEGIDSWTRVFDFSLQADEDSITAGAIDLTLNLHFTVFRGKKPISLRVDNFFELGKEFTMLCTVSDSGHMKVFKDGVLVGEKTDGMAPLHADRPHMMVGGHYLFPDQSFRGSLKDVKVWNLEVPWEASSVSKVAVSVLGEVISEQAEKSPRSESDGRLRGARDAVDPTSESDGDAELSDPEAETLLSRGDEEFARLFGVGAVRVEGSGGIPLATA